MPAHPLHQHAQRSARRGGCNGNYRAIVLCPDHLIPKWKDELEETVPGVKVPMFDIACKACKHLLSDMNRLYAAVRGPNGCSCGEARRRSFAGPFMI